MGRTLKIVGAGLYIPAAFLNLGAACTEGFVSKCLSGASICFSLGAIGASVAGAMCEKSYHDRHFGRPVKKHLF